MNIQLLGCYLSIFGLLVLAGCSKDNSYDSGYDTAWEGEAPGFWANQEEKAGYEQGLDDSWMYDEGYDDSINRKKPKFLSDEFYMDGYKDGKNAR